eukprot:Gb_09785 [translate_table: standard]
MQIVEQYQGISKTLNAEILSKLEKPGINFIPATGNRPVKWTFLVDDHDNRTQLKYPIGIDFFNNFLSPWKLISGISIQAFHLRVCIFMII